MLLLFPVSHMLLILVFNYKCNFQSFLKAADVTRVMSNNTRPSGSCFIICVTQQMQVDC